MAERKQAEKVFTLEEICEFLRAIAKREEPFFGETTQQWRQGKITLFKEAGTRRPE